MQHITKTFYLRPAEYKWVNNVLKLARKNKKIERAIMSGNIDHDIINTMISYRAITKDDHSLGSMNWTIHMTRLIITNKIKVRKHRDGYDYLSLYVSSWRE